GKCRPGIKALLEIANRDPQKLAATTSGFALGPLDANNRILTWHGVKPRFAPANVGPVLRRCWKLPTAIRKSWRPRPRVSPSGR
ncbi:hypothetical protein C3E94_27930, partial [Klebsiella pneumoniae]